MRVLLDEEGLEWDEAWADHNQDLCIHKPYDHGRSIWKNGRLRSSPRLLPRIYQIVEEINRRFILEIEKKYPGNQDKSPQDGNYL